MAALTPLSVVLLAIVLLGVGFAVGYVIGHHSQGDRDFGPRHRIGREFPPGLRHLQPGQQDGQRPGFGPGQGFNGRSGGSGPLPRTAPSGAPTGIPTPPSGTATGSSS